jgi:hypothetical protein
MVSLGNIKHTTLQPVNCPVKDENEVVMIGCLVRVRAMVQWWPVRENHRNSGKNSSVLFRSPDSSHKFIRDRTRGLNHYTDLTLHEARKPIRLSHIIFICLKLTNNYSLCYYIGLEILVAAGVRSSIWRTAEPLHATFSLVLYFDHEDGGGIFLRNIGWISPNCTTLYLEDNSSSSYYWNQIKLVKMLKIIIYKWAQN